MLFSFILCFSLYRYTFYFFFLALLLLSFTIQHMQSKFKQKVKPTEAHTHNNIIFLECDAAVHSQLLKMLYWDMKENHRKLGKCKKLCQYENVRENYDCLTSMHDVYLWVKHESNIKAPPCNWTCRIKFVKNE